tara:strand:- start:445 stop:636 length:192 start_codon:yes stop_codon:yes gene_type:complete
MVFEQVGRLRYHALWAYVGIVAPAFLLDKLPLTDLQGIAAILAPLALVLTADIVKHRNVVTSP